MISFWTIFEGFLKRISNLDVILDDLLVRALFVKYPAITEPLPSSPSLLKNDFLEILLIKFIVKMFKKDKLEHNCKL